MAKDSRTSEIPPRAATRSGVIKWRRMEVILGVIALETDGDERLINTNLFKAFAERSQTGKAVFD